MTTPDFPLEVIEKAARAMCEAMGMDPDYWSAWKWEATIVLAAGADDLYQRGFTEGGEEALTSALHPEFGTEWREPGGVIWKEYHRGMVEGAERATVRNESEAWEDGYRQGRAEGMVAGVREVLGDMEKRSHMTYYSNALKVARETVARIEKGAGS